MRKLLVSGLLLVLTFASETLADVSDGVDDEEDYNKINSRATSLAQETYRK
jgi:hypothetical protein